jgi:signal transduction histidine kinase
LVAAGCVWLLVGLDTTPNVAVAGFGFIFASAPAAIVWHILLAFPNGRLQTRWARAVVFANWFSHVVLWIPQWLYNPGTPWAIGDNLHIAHTWHNIELYVVTIPLTVAGVVILVRRIRQTDVKLRWVLWPLHGYGVFTAFAVPLIYDVLGPRLGLAATTVTGLQLYTVAVVPIFFAAAALSPAFGRMGQVDELAARLGQGTRSERDLQDELGRTLGDPSLRLLVWLAEYHRYVDADGSVVELPPPDSNERGVELIDVADRPVGAIVYNRILIADPAPVQAAAQVVALAVDRERLLADLRATEEALRQSRARIVEAGDVQRRAFAQSLHDSVQGPLVLLAIQARALADAPGVPEAVRAEALSLWAGIDATASDLRQQVHTVMPAALLERGLVAAIEDYVDRMPVHTSLTVGDVSEQLPAAVQTTAYFIVVEGLTNAVKHARASRISVVLDEEAEGLVVTVEDDGVGAASTDGGTGLRGLADRADALGGRLTFDSVAGRGSRLTAVLPSESVPSARV